MRAGVLSEIVRKWQLNLIGADPRALQLALEKKQFCKYIIASTSTAENKIACIRWRAASNSDPSES
jgi:hypothetical protein